MRFWRKKRAITGLALVVMLAYALVPPGLLAACGCGECACAAVEDAGQCCCSHPFGSAAMAPDNAVGLKPCCLAKAAASHAGASCQQNCSAHDACECSPTDGSQPAQTAQTTEVKSHDQAAPLFAFAPPANILADSRISEAASFASLAPTPPLRILLCVWRN